ncbi:MAG: leucine-rich repeat domain-containing protein, partial [Clostridia bacterium]|nr:leucine-rich repeat domain-containing protein [Clostridia bacterium]
FSITLLSAVSCDSNQNSNEKAGDINNTNSTVGIVDGQTEEPDQNPLDKMRAESLLYPSQNNEWKYNVYSTYIEITGYIGDPVAELIVPEKIDDLPVKAYSPPYSFNSISPTTVSVKLPGSLIIIGENAFSNDLTLTSIHLPEGLIEIGDNAFDSCIKLSELKLPSTIRKIGSSAFQHTKMESLIIPASIEEIGAGAFWGCNELKEVTILNSDITLDVSNLNCDMLYGYIGSTAAAYAAKAGISFKPIDNE